MAFKPAAALALICVLLAAAASFTAATLDPVTPVHDEGEGLLCDYACLMLGWHVGFQALLPLPLHPTAPSPSSAVALMRRWRDVLHAADPAWTAGWSGWLPGDTAHPCLWSYVKCDHQRRITHLSMSDSGIDAHPSHAAAQREPAAGRPLLPELAGLQHLTSFELAYLLRPVHAALPPEWCRPGAFPRLTE